VTRVLIVGVSARAAAESAARAGFDVTAVDAFGDLDQHPGVRALSLPRDCAARPTAPAAARVARAIPADAVVYLSSFENHPRAVAVLAAGRELWGNPPDVLRRVRDPHLVADAWRRHGFAAPQVALDRPIVPACPPGWMLKPLRSGGGQRVRHWRGGKVPRDSYLQEYVEGDSGSVVFVAAGGKAVPLGVSRQLIGDPAFGGDGFRYCGSILAPGDDPQLSPALVERAGALARAAAAEFALVGVNGIDFIVRDDVPHPVEINPRWTASMELVEHRSGLSVFGAHVRACRDGTLPRVEPAGGRDGRAVGKAVVYARRAMTMGDTRAWLDDPTVRDVPHPGERIAAGQPICTVFAEAPDARRCYSALVERAGRVYGE
jgi:predicted ATP-grasp superfamily ATP-dependent carboligase